MGALALQLCEGQLCELHGALKITRVPFVVNRQMLARGDAIQWVMN
jgi:hypothetical protein